MNKKIIENKLNELKAMPIKELKAEWHRYFECNPPKFNRINLERRLAYRIQEKAYGSLKEETKILLENLAHQHILKRQKKKYKRLRPGSIITKKYNGLEHRILIAQNGYEYNGRKFSNLSIIARIITGTRWSGPVFFGLEEFQK